MRWLKGEWDMTKSDVLLHDSAKRFATARRRRYAFIGVSGRSLTRVVKHSVDRGRLDLIQRF